MKITTKHSASSYGVPVILSDGGEVMDYAPGVRAVRGNLSRRVFAGKIGVSKRTVEGWENGYRVPNPAALNAMADWLAKGRPGAGGR